MAYVIAEPCVDVMDKACLVACPVACIDFKPESDRKLYIDPDGCIDCNACATACPEEAIFSEYELPLKWHIYLSIDVVWFRDRDTARELVNKQKPPNTS